jgi:fatty acid hydroxylase domain-containing protein 2
MVKIIVQVLSQVVFNQLAVGIPTAYLSFSLMKWRGIPPLRELPTFHWVLAEMAFLILIEEIGFYYSHR